MGQDLDRFLKAQKVFYKDALEEIRQGHKQSHWMWFIFPQILVSVGCSLYLIFYFLLYYYALAVPSGKIILFTKKNTTIDTPPFNTVVPILYSQSAGGKGFS